MTNDESALPNGGGIGAGIAIGVALGVALGTALDNLGLGIAIGASIGVALGAAFERDDTPPTPGLKRLLVLLVLAGLLAMALILFVL